ncbi:YbaY family lipoprotein [Serratia sp. M24T3]|uniref:YbaY family lipoprotein n=1 Tax=Rouxiella sp. WC2420 TaxID=3234145 RepID=A0AB39VPH8_9GAMM|nr:YbaY family lipoprotein [Serratia sp. M24T3]EIC82352.1 putative lipoprotein [Serratia sp. M24T3]
MKLWQIVGGTALSFAIAGCSSHQPTPPPASPNSTASSSSSPAITGPNVSGVVNISQAIALPPDAVLTVTLSDASVPNAPSRIIAQKVARTQGKQAPFSFILPFNPQDIQPNARILLSAAVTMNNRVVFITDNIKEVITDAQGTRADLNLVPVPSVPVATKPAGLGPMGNPMTNGSNSAPMPPMAPTSSW